MFALPKKCDSKYLSGKANGLEKADNNFGFVLGQFDSFFY